VFTGTAKLAFSAGLSHSGSMGPFPPETPIIYGRVFTNIGGAYNPTTGMHYRKLLNNA